MAHKKNEKATPKAKTQKVAEAASISLESAKTAKAKAKAENAEVRETPIEETPIEETPKTETPKVEKPKPVLHTDPALTVAEIAVGERLEKLLAAPLEVYGKKSLEGNPAKMRPGSTVIFEKLAQTLESGNHVVSVRKANSSRIFYTTEDKTIVTPEPAAPAATDAIAAVNESLPAEDAANETANVNETANEMAEA